MKKPIIATLLAGLAASARRMVSVENDAVVLDIVNAQGEAAIFELQQDGSFFIPFGEYPHKKGLQIFDNAAAQEMRAFAKSMAGRVLGMPLYIGHPDVPGRPDTNPAAPAVGWFTDISIENDGARFHTKLGPRGKEAVENAEFRFYSPNWACQRVAGGKLRPVRLKSMGLTNNPNIPVPAIANDSTQTEQTMNPELLKLLGLDAAANDGAGPTAEEIQAASIKLAARLQTAENDAARIPGLDEQIATLTTRATDAEGKVTQLENDLATARTSLSAANDAVVAARGARIDITLDRAVETGRIAEADRAARREQLVAIANDAELTTALQEIENAKPTIKTASKVTGMDRAKANIHADNDAVVRSENRRKAVEQELSAIANDLPPHERHNLAWERAAKKSPELFQDKKAD